MAAPTGATNESLRRAVQHCAAVLGCDDAMLYSWDAERDRLVARASTDAQRGYEHAVELSLGEGVVGWSALNREVVLIDDFPTEDLRFRVVPGLDKLSYRSFLAIPLSTQGTGLRPTSEVQGVLVARHQDAHQFTLEHVQSIEAVCQLIASLVSVGEQSSDDQLFAAVRRIAEIGSAEGLAHSEVPTLIARELANSSGADLVAIVAPARTGRPYLDILGVGVGANRGPNPLRQQQIQADAVQAAIAAEGPLRREAAERLFDPLGAGADAFTSVTAHPLEARGTNLGTVLAYQSDITSGRDRTSERLASLIRQTSVSLALTELTAKPVRNAAEGRLIDLLFSSQIRPALAAQLSRETGFDPADPHCVVVGQPSDANQLGAAHQQLTSIERAIRREHPSAVCDLRADNVWAIVKLAGRTPSDIAAGLANRLTAIGYGHIGVSDPVSADNYRRALSGATTAVQVSVRVPGMAKAMAVADTGAYRYLLTLVDTQHPTALEASLAELRASDEPLFNTVATYVDNGCRPSPTARALHLHRNSLAGRLRSASAVLGVPIDESSRLVLELAINLVLLR